MAIHLCAVIVMSLDLSFNLLSCLSSCVSYQALAQRELHYLGAALAAVARGDKVAPSNTLNSAQPVTNPTAAAMRGSPVGAGQVTEAAEEDEDVLGVLQQPSSSSSSSGDEGGDVDSDGGSSSSSGQGGGLWRGNGGAFAALRPHHHHHHHHHHHRHRDRQQQQQQAGLASTFQMLLQGGRREPGSSCTAELQELGEAVIKQHLAMELGASGALRHVCYRMCSDILVPLASVHVVAFDLDYVLVQVLPCQPHFVATRTIPAPSMWAAAVTTVAVLGHLVVHTTPDPGTDMLLQLPTPPARSWAAVHL
jgi:hypothetical protein